jgi:hypothetical protein
MFCAKHGEKLALVLDDHSGAELCGFDAAHYLCDRWTADISLEDLLISEIPEGEPILPALHAE